MPGHDSIKRNTKRSVKHFTPKNGDQEGGSLCQRYSFQLHHVIAIVGRLQARKVKSQSIEQGINKWHPEFEPVESAAHNEDLEERLKMSNHLRAA